MFYIKPPRGDILLDDLQECVRTRINYFLCKHQEDSSTNSKDRPIKFQYLTIGSAYDRTGHFMLRLLSANSQMLREFVISSEANFTIERLEYLTSKEIIQLIKTTLRHLNEACMTNQKDEVWNAGIKNILADIKPAFNCMHMKSLNHNENCTSYSIKVPFQLSLKLVAERELKLDRGRAEVPCGKWSKFLKCCIEAHIRREVEKIENSSTVLSTGGDQRLQDLRNLVLGMFLKKPMSKEKVNLTDLEKLSRIFPPCMGYLYNNLKVHHRLSHNARFSLSLFLKDIGMSLNESISFWQSEYSKPSKCGVKCAHSWQKNSSKYIYSIRHMYGLEGRRANYCSFSCSKIMVFTQALCLYEDWQSKVKEGLPPFSFKSNSLGATEEGGCPFSNFDIKTLKTLLENKVIQNEETLNKIQMLASQGESIKACDYYRKTLMDTFEMRTEHTLMDHSTPVEYFSILNQTFCMDVR